MRLLTTAVAITVSFAAEAAFVDGNILHEACRMRTASTNYDEFVSGYVTGAVDHGHAIAASNKFAPPYCLPEKGLKSGQVGDMVCKYLSEHPQNRHRSAGILVEQALRTAWPCTAQ
jgi:hypothetical protein